MAKYLAFNAFQAKTQAKSHTMQHKSRIFFSHTPTFNINLGVQKVDASSGRITAKVVTKKNSLIHLILDKNNRKFEKS